MRIAILPFFSQVDKVSKQFLLEACCTTQISIALAEALKTDHEISLCAPRDRDLQTPHPPGTRLIDVSAPMDNTLQRLSVRTDDLLPILKQHDLIISHHELLSFPMRVMCPAIKICQINHMQAIGDWTWMDRLQRLSWSAADKVVFLSELLRNHAAARLGGWENTSFDVWPLIYDRARLEQSRLTGWKVHRFIDLLFIQRCSSSNYTHHEEFLKAVKLIRLGESELRVVFTDPTHYLESTHGPDPDFEYLRAKERTTYYQTLARTNYAIALMEHDLHGGIAIREAIASNAIPILLDTPAYRDLIGSDTAYYPGFIPLDDLSPVYLATRLEWLINDEMPKWLRDHSDELERIKTRVMTQSYQAVIESKVKPWINSL